MVQYCLAPPCVAVWVEFGYCRVDLDCSSALFVLCLLEEQGLCWALGRLKAAEVGFGYL